MGRAGETREPDAGVTARLNRGLRLVQPVESGAGPEVGFGAWPDIAGT